MFRAVQCSAILTRSAEGRKVYHSYRLVRSERSGERVRQRTLLNLGSDFAVATEYWAVLCSSSSRFPFDDW